jgi:hypothetical protein
MWTRTRMQREMIRRTIKEHLDKEKRLRPLGIKVLSLFFIDAVEHYRQYDADGQPVKGVYAQIFEEEYRRAAKSPGSYQSLFQGGRPDVRPPRRCTTAISRSTRRAAGPTPPRTTSRATGTMPSGPTT